MGAYGANYGANYAGVAIAAVVVPPKISISHVTLDAGVDLRKRKTTQRLQQTLKLTTEIRTTGTTRKPLTLNIKTQGKTRQISQLLIQTTGLSRLKTFYAIPITGTSKVKHVSAIITNGTKGGTRKIIDILKQVLREIDQ